jgi:hypothetical protein
MHHGQMGPAPFARSTMEQLADPVTSKGPRPFSTYGQVAQKEWLGHYQKLEPTDTWMPDDDSPYARLHAAPSSWPMRSMQHSCHLLGAQDQAVEQGGATNGSPPRQILH